MFDPVPIPYDPIDGLDITVFSPTEHMHRFNSLEPNRQTELLELQQGTWTVSNNSPFILRLDASTNKHSCHIWTLHPSEYRKFSAPGDQYKLSATLLISSQVFHLPTVDSENYLQQASALNLSKWEYLFYQYMIAARTNPSRISEGNSKTPDFEISLAERMVPVELKEFSRNPQEREQAQGLNNPKEKVKVVSDEIGHRLAKAANSARRQLRSFQMKQGDGPAILAVFDPCRLGHAEPHHVAAVLEGHMTVSTARCGHSSIRAFRKENRRRAPHARNKILSSIAVLRLSPKEGLAQVSGTEAKYEEIVANLLVYHNAYAMHPVSPRAFAQFGFPQFTFASTAHSAVRTFL